MKSRKVINHHKRVHSSDIDYIKKNYEELLDETEGLPFSRELIMSNDKNGKFRYTDYRAPRPALTLLMEAFCDHFFIENRTSKAADFITRLVLPRAGIKADGRPVRGVFRLGGSGLYSCAKAEKYFVDTVRQANTGQDLGQGYISIYHDRSGVPIAMRKYREQSSALTLEPVELEGVILPPGTIVRVGHDMSDQKTGELQMQNTQLTTFLVEKDAEPSISASRLSPWAYTDPLDRSIFALSSSYENPVLRFDPNRANLATYNSIDDFRAAAHKVVDMVLG